MVAKSVVIQTYTACNQTMMCGISYNVGVTTCQSLYICSNKLSWEAIWLQANTHSKPDTHTNLNLALAYTFLVAGKKIVITYYQSTLYVIH